MEYIMGVCPQCNNVMSMPDDSELVRCPTCQSEVVMAEAAALAGNAAQGAAAQPAPGPSAATQPAPDPYAAAQMQAPGQPMAAGATPFLGQWKTNVLFTVLGILASVIFNGFIGGSGDAEDYNAALGGITTIFALAYVVFAIVYAVKIYPSYFSEKPDIESNEAVSFLNGFVGGVIFGLLWNHNLTLKNKGISNIVFVSLIAATFVLGFIGIFILAGMVVGGM